LAQQFALHVAGAGLTSLFLSQEMPIGEVADRAIAHLGRMDYGGLSVGRVDNWDALTEAGHAAVKLPMWLDDEGALTLRKVQHKARSVRGLQVLVVDYLQLMQSDGKADGNRNAEIEAISRGLKALAKQLGMAVVVLSQLNRQVEQRTNKRPVLADLRDSGAIEQDADVVLMLWPHRDLDRGQRVVGAAVAKNRQGRQGEVALHFDGTRQRWGASTENLASDDGPKTKGRSL
jgi:replicative DNA helicase